MLDTLQRWRAGNRRAAIATVAGVERSAARGPGAALPVDSRRRRSSMATLRGVEIVGVRSGRSGRRLNGTTGPIH